MTAGGSPSWVGSTIADQLAEEAVAAQCGGNANHRFTFNTPVSVKTGQPYTIHAYAINTPNQPENGTYYNVDIGSQNATCRRKPEPKWPRGLGPGFRRGDEEGQFGGGLPSWGTT